MSTVGEKLYTLCKEWSEWSSRAWIGFSCPKVKEIAEFLDKLENLYPLEEERFHIPSLYEYDFREIAEGLENLPEKPTTVVYHVWVVEKSAYPKTVMTHIARIEFDYMQHFPDIDTIEVHEKIIVDGVKRIVWDSECARIVRYEIPSEPRLWTRDFKWFEIEPPEFEPYMDFESTDGAMNLKGVKKGVPAPFDTYSEQLW